MTTTPTPRSSAARNPRANNSWLRLATSSSLALLLALEAIPAARAQSTWDGGANSTNLNSGVNWVGDTAPANNTAWVFGSTNGSQGTTLNNDFAANFTNAGITFNAGSLAYTFNGNQLTLGGGIVNNSTALQTFNINGILSGVRTFTTTNGGGNITWNGVLSGTGGLAKTGVGTLTLVNAGNTFTGNTTISEGALQIGTGGRLNSGAYAGTIGISNSATFFYNSTAAQTLSGAISGGGSLTKGNTGALTLSASNSYTGGTVISGGSIQINNTNALGTTGNIDFEGGTLIYNGGIATDLSGRIRNSAGVIALNLGTNNVTYASVIDSSNLNGLSKAGTGTLTLTAINTFTGNTTISAGALKISGAGLIGGGTYNGAITNTGVLAYNSSATQTLGGMISGTGSLSMEGPGTLILSGINLFNSTTRVNAGTLVLNNGMALQNSLYDTGGAGTVAIANGVSSIAFGGLTGSGAIAPTGYASLSALAVNSAAGVSNTYSGGISNGAAALTFTKTGAGTQTLSGNNTYTGATLVNAGVLQFTRAASLYNGDSSAWTADNIQVGSGATVGFSVGTNSGAFTSNNITTLLGNLTNSAGSGLLAGATLGLDATGTNFTLTNGLSDSVNGSLGLVAYGTGTVTLNGVNTYTGNTTISAGTLQIAGAGKLGSGNYNGTIANAGTFLVNSSANQTLGGVISGVGSLSKESSGTLTLSAANNYSGGTTLNGGTLKLSNQNALQGSTLTMNGGALVLDSAVAGNAFSIGGLAGSSGGEGYDIGLTNSAGTGVALTVGGNNASTTYAGALSGGGSLNKAGGGVLTLAGVNTYTGATTISGGTLALDFSSLATPANVISSSSALTLQNGSLSLLGKGGSGVTSSQTFNGATLANGLDTIRMTNGASATSTTLNLGAVMRNAGSVIVMDPATAWGVQTAPTSEIVTVASVANNGTTISLPGSGWSYIGAGFISSSNNYLQVNSSGQMAQGAAPTAMVTSGGDAATVYNLGTTTLTGNLASYALRNNNAAAVTYNLSTFTNTLNGIMNAGSGLVTVTSGTLTAGTEKDLVLLSATNGGITIASTIMDSASGASALTFSRVNGGTGTLTLSAANSYSGGTFVNGGTVSLNVTGALGTGAVTLNNGSQLIGNGNSRTMANAITLGATGSGLLNGVNSGGSGSAFWANGTLSGGTGSTLTLAGNMVGVAGDASQFYGTFVVNAGQGFYGASLTNANVVITSGAAFSGWGGNGAIQVGSLSGGGTIGGTYGGGSALSVTAGYLGINSTYNGVIASGNNGGFNKVGGGTQTLTGTNTYTGGTTVTGGTLEIGGAGQLASGNYGSGIAVSSGTAFAYNSSANQTLGGVISGAGSLVKNGPGMLTLTAANTLTGGTTLGAGALNLANQNALQNSTLTINWGSLIFNSSVAGNAFTLGGLASTRSGLGYDIGLTNSAGNGINLSVGNLNSNSTYAGVLSGSGTLTKIGTGVMTLNNANTYSGGTVLNAGGVVMSNANALGTSGNITFGGGTLTYGAGITTDLSGRIKGSAGAIVIDSGANVLTFDSVIDNSNAGGLSKAGAGTITLNGVNTFTGNTVISAGTLAIGGAGQLGSGNYAGTMGISNGATFNFNSSANQTNTGAITGTGTITKTGAGTLTLAASSPNFTGSVNVNTGALKIRNGTAGAITNGAAFTIANGATLLGETASTANSGTPIQIWLTNANAITFTGAGGGTLNFGTNVNFNVGANSTITSAGGAQNVIDGGSSAGSAGMGNATAGATVTYNVARGTDANADLLVNARLREQATNIKSGNGILALTAANVNTGGWLFNAGTLAISNNAALGTGTLTFAAANTGTLDALLNNMAIANAQTLTGNGTYNVGSDLTFTNSGAISGGGALTKTGSGTMVLANVNTFSGGTTVNAGALALTANGNVSGVGSLRGAVTVNSGGLLSLQATDSIGWLAGSSVTNIVINGGTVNNAVVGNQGYLADITMTGGSVTSTGGGSFHFAGRTITTLATNVGALFSAPITLRGASTNTFNIASGTTGDGVDLLVSGQIRGDGGWVETNSIVKSGAGNLVLTGTNWWRGTTVISEGTLTIGGSGILGSTTNTGAVVVANYTQNITNSGTLAYNSTANQTNSGVISGTGKLTKGSIGTLTLAGANNTFSGGLDVNAGQVTAGAANALGTGALSVSSGTADYTYLDIGNFNQSVGSVSVGENGVIYGGSGTLTGTTYNVDVAQFASLASVLGGASATLTKSGTGVLYLAANNSYGGGSSLNGGSIVLSASNGLGTNGNITFRGGTLTYDTGYATDLSGRIKNSAGAIAIDSGANAITFASAIDSSNSNGLSKTGTGTLTLSGANSYSGVTTLNAGQLNINNDSALGSGAFTIAGGNINNTSGAARTITNALNLNSDFTFVGGANLNQTTGAIALNDNRTITVSANTLSLGGVISDGGAGYSLTKAGTGSLTLVGANTFSGGTFLNAGQININNDSALGSGAFTIAGGSINNTSGAARTIANALNLNSDFTFVGSTNLTQTTGAIALNANRMINVTANTLSLGGVISGAGYSITKAGAGALTLAGANNSFSGGLNVNAGTVTAGAENALGSGSVTVTGGTLAIGNFNQSVGAVSLGNVTVTGGTGTLTGSSYNVTNSGAATISAILGGSGVSLTKAGNGALTLSAANSYTGGTLLTAGTIVVNNTSALGSGTVTLSNGAQLYAGNLTIANAIALGSGTGSMYGNNSGGYGSTFNITGALTGEIGSRFTSLGNQTRLSGDLSGFFGTLVVNNLLQLTGTQNLTNAIVEINGGSIRGNSGGTFQLGSLSGSGFIGGTFTGTSANNLIIGYLNTSTTFGGTIDQPNTTTSLTKVGTGTLTLTGVNTYTRFTTISGGGLEIGGAGQLGSGNYAGAISITNGSTLSFNSSANQTLGGAISGAGSMIKGGTGTLTLSVANSYTGGTTVNDGFLVVGTNGALGANTGRLTLNGGTLVLGGFTITQGTFTQTGGSLGTNGSTSTLTAATYALNGGTVNAKLGAGTVNVGGNSTLNGTVAATAVNVTNGGTLNLGADELLTNTAAVTVGTGGTLNLGSFNDTVGSLTNTGTLNGSGTLTASTYALNNGSVNANLGAGTVNVGGNSTLNGTAAAATVNLNSGTLTLGASDRLASNAAVAVASTLNLNGNNQRVGALTGSGTVSNTGAGLLTVANNAGANSTFAGSITGGGLSKLGAGTLTLTGQNSYAGTTTVNGGTLSVNSTNTISSSSDVSLANNALFRYTGGGGILGNNFNVTSGTGGIWNSGGGLLTLSGTLNKTGTILGLYGGSYNVTGKITGNSGSFNSDLLLSNAVVTLSTAADYSGPTYLIAGSSLTAGVNNALPTDTTLSLGKYNGVTDGSGVVNTLDLGGKNVTIKNLYSFGDSTGAINRIWDSDNSYNSTLTITGDSAFGGSIGGLTGANRQMHLTVTGGNVNLTGNNTYTGGTTITNGGTIDLGGGGFLSGTSNIVISAGSSLLLGGAGRVNPVNSSANLELIGGGSGNVAKLSMGGLGASTRTASQNFASLTLTGNSVIDFTNLTGNSTLTFGSITFNTGSNLSIWNWNASYTKFIDNTTLSKADLSKISFYSGSGSGFLGTGGFSSGLSGEIVPVPEPGVVIAACMLLGWLLVSNRGALLRRRS